MRMIHYIVLLLTFTSSLHAEIPDSLLRINHVVGMHYYPGAGVIPDSLIPADRKFDIEGLYKDYTRENLPEVYADLNFFYSNYIIQLSPEEKQKEVERMKDAARRYKSSKLADEARYLDAYILYDQEVRTESIAHAMRIMRQFERQRNIPMTVRIKYAIMTKLYYFGEDYYYDAFKMADELLAGLEEVTEEEFPEKRYAYCEAGNLYYSFHDYDRAIPLLEKALTEEKSRYYFDRSNLKARNTLAVYYYSIGDLEKSTYYYLSMLTSKDDVWLRAMYDAIALSNLGGIHADRGDCETAIRLFKAAIPVAITEGDYSFASGSLIGMGQCYLKRGEVEKAREIIDTVLVYIQDPLKYVSEHRYRNLYPLMSKYYLRKGDIARSELYTDSAAIAEKRYQEVFNTRILLKAQQALFNAEKSIREEKIAAQHRQLILSLIITGIILSGLILIVYMYRKKNAAYRELVRKSRQWAYNNSLSTEADSSATEWIPAKDSEVMGEDEKLIRTTHERILKEELYKDCGLSIDSLAEKMEVTRGSISKAINTTGKNFNQYINEYRIKEAVRLLLSTPGDQIYMEELYERVGFNSRSSFYRAFKQNTGLSPSEFRNNMG